MDHGLKCRGCWYRITNVFFFVQPDEKRFQGGAVVDILTLSRRPGLQRCETHTIRAVSGCSGRGFSAVCSFTYGARYLAHSMEAICCFWDENGSEVITFVGKIVHLSLGLVFEHIAFPSMSLPCSLVKLTWCCAVCCPGSGTAYDLASDVCCRPQPQAKDGVTNMRIRAASWSILFSTYVCSIRTSLLEGVDGGIFM